MEDSFFWAVIKLLPILFGGAALIIVTVSIFFDKCRWPAVVVAFLAVALVGGGIFSRLILNKDGVQVVTALEATEGVITKLQNVVKENSDAIVSLNKKIEDVIIVAKQSSGSDMGSSTFIKKLDDISIKGAALNDLLKKQGTNLNDISSENQRLREAIGSIKENSMSGIKF